MTQSLARALAPLIRVNTVCPGYIDTPWFNKGRGEAGAKAVRDAVVAKVPLKVASTAEDIAQPVCFLASPASSNMTGEFVRMDAGHASGACEAAQGFARRGSRGWWACTRLNLEITVRAVRLCPPYEFFTYYPDPRSRGWPPAGSR